MDKAQYDFLKDPLKVLVSSGCFDQIFFSLGWSNSADYKYGKFTILVFILLKPRIGSFHVVVQWEAMKCLQCTCRTIVPWVILEIGLSEEPVDPL